MPVHFMYRSVPFDELVALYALADGSLITPTRDGMNLVCYEYIAAQKESQGITMLSEFAGAAESLDSCVLLNP
jgi:trehalose-6-phosphate synthase